MPIKVFTPLLFLFLTIALACSTSKDQRQQVGRDTVASHVDTPPSIVPNVTLIGAVITAIAIVDEFQYTLDVELRTAIPEGHSPSIAEPGQRVRVVPSYRLDEQRAVVMSDERNKRLMDVRSKNVGDFLLGKIVLSNDGTWYLIDTELQ